jgi:gliding motility-associated-like protein
MLYLPPALPLPDGSAFMSITQYFYMNSDIKETDIGKVYISQCLQSPLVPGEQYTLSFSAGRFQSFDDPKYKFKSTPFTVAIFGNADCNAVPFGPLNATSNGCPSNYKGWQLLGKVKMISKGKWIQNKIDFNVSSNINVIAIGPDCSLINPDNDLQDSTTYLDYYVYDLDDLHLLHTKDFHFQYIQTQGGNPCDSISALSVPFFSNTSYQWYKDSVAIIGANSNSLHVAPENAEGNYNVVISNADSCITSQPFFINSNNLQNFTLPHDTSLCENDSLLLAPPLDGISYNWNGNTGNFVKIFNEGIYEITASAANGCSKRFTVNVHSQNCNLFMPNAFTPNGDGKNDVFRIPVSVKINLENFSIFDRWGNKVFSTNKREGAWDGMYKGVRSAAGTYIYIIRGNVNNKKTELKGFVTLIR